MGHIPVGMEAFQASDEDQWQYIKRRIEESDYYVVIVGERYGSQLKGKSYTQMEYEYAVEKGVPVAAFLLDSSVRKTWPSDRVEFEQRDKIEKFRRTCQKKLVKYWRNGDELGTRVSSALYELMNQKPRIGWVRANSLPSATVLEEITRLSEEKRELLERIKEISENDGKLKVPPKAFWMIDHLKSKLISDFCKTKGILPNQDESLLSFFLGNANSFAAGISITASNRLLLRKINGTKEFSNESNAVAHEIFSEILISGLIEKYINATNSTLYRITDAGRDLIMYNREIEKNR